MLKALERTFLDLLYPSDLYCICCHKIIDGSRPYHLCNDCMKSIKWIDGKLCEKCGKILSPNNPGSICFNCKQNEHSFNRGYTCSEYGMQNRSMVYSLKYDEHPEIAKVIAEIMVDRMSELFTKEELKSKYNLLIPVPVSREKMQMRGYNQAALIAKYLSRKTDLRYEGEILKRDKDTSAMKGLDPMQRRNNIKGSFSVLPWHTDTVKGQSCLIVDDIVTTGTTVDEIAMVLYENGAKQVDFISFANGADVIKSE